ncbi:MAG: hypothetical protein HC802_23265 [Caldilineaceae bacterium]|nr:hypothetical protein [Caldilineaceae bacterium]
MTPVEWLTREDEVCHPDRLARLQWLSGISPKAEYWTFPGGLLAKCLFEEARYCFVYGQFLAAIVLGIAYIEHTVAALFFATGRNDLERASLTQLLKEALNHGWINQREYANLQHARQIRNPITHFRKPGDDETIEYRLVMGNELPYSIIEEDAHHVIETALRLLEKNAA